MQLVLLKSQIHTVKYWAYGGSECYCVWDYNILAAVRTRPANPELLHFMDQCSALHAKFNGSTLWATHYPTDSVERL